MRGRHDRRDEIEAQVVAACLAVGCSVTRISESGAPDLLLGRCGETFLVELKRPKVGTFTEAQQRWHQQWKGRPPIVATSVAEVLNAIGAVE